MAEPSPAGGWRAAFTRALREFKAGFMRAANVIYDVPEGRPMWKTAWPRFMRIKQQFRGKEATGRSG